MPENESTLKITMGSVRLTADQSQRLLNIHLAKTLECYEYWDVRLRELGLVYIGTIPPHLKTANEKWLAAAWIKVRGMVTDKRPADSKINEIEGLLNQMRHTSHRIGKKYSTLTAAGKDLASTGRTVILPVSMRGTRE